MSILEELGTRWTKSKSGNTYCNMEFLSNGDFKDTCESLFKEGSKTPFEKDGLWFVPIAKENADLVYVFETEKEATDYANFKPNSRFGAGSGSGGKSGYNNNYSGGGKSGGYISKFSGNNSGGYKRTGSGGGSYSRNYTTAQDFQILKITDEHNQSELRKNGYSVILEYGVFKDEAGELCIVMGKVFDVKL